MSDQKLGGNEFSFDDIPIQSKKLTFEELLAQNLKNEDQKNEDHIFGKNTKVLVTKTIELSGEISHNISSRGVSKRASGSERQR